MDKFLNALNIDVKNIQIEAPEVFAVGGKEYEAEKMLAAGAFADVFLVHDGAGNKLVAKKQLLNEHTNALVTREITLMKKFNHRNLVQFLGAAKIPDSAYVVIIMELCGGGTLFDLLDKRKPKGALTEAGVLKIVSDCVAGVKYMHDLGLAHWDLKLENVLQGRDNAFKLCDFGSVVDCPLPCGTPEEWGMLEEKIGQFTSESYRAPEMCDNFGVSELTVKTDVWALGSIIYACCFFTLPFMNQGKLGILNGKYPISAGHRFSPGLIKIIDRCFQLQPAHRADCNEASPPFPVPVPRPLDAL
jgi:AP2-associated kinase